jgi:hypothetical protein
MGITDQRPQRHHRRPRGRRRLARQITALVVARSIGTAALSYTHALTYPGNASWQVRTVEWVRDHGGTGLVNAVENWWFAHNVPTGIAPPASSLPSVDSASITATAAQLPHLPLLPGVAPLPGEGSWVPGAQRMGGVPALYTGWFRPDPAYPSQIVGTAWIDQSVTVTRLIAGTKNLEEPAHATTHRFPPV